jgi:hypothetical protein
MSGGLPPAKASVSCSVRLEELMTLTLLPVFLPQAVAAALSALVSAGPEEAIMKLRVTPWVGPTRGVVAAMAVPGDIAATTKAVAAMPVMALVLFIWFVPFCNCQG